MVVTFNCFIQEISCSYCKKYCTGKIIPFTEKKYQDKTYNIDKTRERLS